MKEIARKGAPQDLIQASAVWPTPMANDATGSTHCYGPKDETGERAIFLKLPGAAKQWPTPMVSDVMRASGTYMRGNPTLKGLATARPTPSAKLGDPRCGFPSPETGASRFESGRRNLDDAAAMWGTPTTKDWKDGACADSAAPTNGLLGRQVLRSLPGQMTSKDGENTSSAGRSLNPLFVEALMGWPIGWTDCALVETESSHSKPPSPGEPYGLAPSEIETYEKAK